MLPLRLQIVVGLIVSLATLSGCQLDPVQPDKGAGSPVSSPITVSASPLPAGCPPACRGANLSERDLSGLDLREAELQQANLAGADLRWTARTGALLPEGWEDIVAAY